MDKDKEQSLRKKCFVIMPFSKTTEDRNEEYWTNHFEDFLKPLIEETGHFMAYRSSALREDLISSIISQLVMVPVVVADLTDYNPNVLWELGVRQSFLSGTITIAEKGTTIPFNLSTKGMLLYDKSDSILTEKKFNKPFQKALLDCIQHPEYNDSRVLETISGRGSLYEIIKYGENLRKLEALIQETSYNRDVINKYLKMEKRNIESLDAMLSLRDECIKLIITERYLNLDNKLISRFYSYFNNVKDLNNMFQSIRLGKARIILKRRFKKAIGRDILLRIRSSFSTFYELLIALYTDLNDKNQEKLNYN